MPIGKRKIALRIDRTPANPFGVAGGDAGNAGGVDQGAPPIPPTIPAPTLISLTPSLLQSAVTPSAQIAVVWTNLETNDQETYRVQVATDSTFTASVGIWATGQNQANAVVGPLKVSTTYYVRVQTIVGNSNSDWSNVLSTTTPADTTVPGVPTATAATFQGVGDLIINWANPTSANFQTVEIGIWSDSGKTTQYALIYDATGKYIWTAAQNLIATSGVGDPTVYVELRSRSYNNVFSTAVIVGTITKAVPATPGAIVQSWSGDTGTAGADWTISWAAQTDAAYYLLNIDGVGARRVYGNTYTYTFDKNVADNGAADPTLSYSVIASDGLNQNSTAATGTATNAAPATTAITVVGGFSTIAVAVTASAAVDFRDYTFRVIKDSSTVATYVSKSKDQVYTATAAGSYQVGVIVNDVFGQASAETVSSAVPIDALTVADLRAESAYSDSLGTTPATLKAALADELLTSGGISYASNAGWVRWIQEVRPLLDRYRTITLSMTPSSGTSNWYVRLSVDGVTWSYFSGPVVSSRILTAVADASAAQTAAVSAATLGGQTTSRVDLPATVEARYVEVWLRNTTVSTRVDEFYPRRLVQSDDMQAETIKAINIAVGTITADRLSVIQLSAIAADMGSLTAGSIVIGSTNKIWLNDAADGALNIGGSTKASAPFRVTAAGALTATNATITGTVNYGAGAGILDSNGSAIALAGTTPNTINSYRFTSSGTKVGWLYGYNPTGATTIGVESVPLSGRAAILELTATGPSSQNGQVFLKATGNNLAAEVDVTLDANADQFIVVAGSANFSGGINVGSGSGASAGQVITSGWIGQSGGFGNIYVKETNAIGHTLAMFTGEPGLAYNSGVIGYNWFPLSGSTTGRQETGTGGSFIRFGEGGINLAAVNAAGAANIMVDFSNTTLAFFGVTKVAKQTVTGSRGGNAALASFLTAMANYGLIVNSTTA